MSATDISGESLVAIVNGFAGLTLTGVIKIIVLAIVLLILVKLLCKLFLGIIEKSKIDPSLHGFLRATIKIVLYFIAVMILAGSLNVDVTSLIALLSVAGLALSLALQGALGNLASGIVILTTKPFHVGDYVSIGAEEGFVEEIGMTYTRLATWDKRVIHIPNSSVTSANVVNYSTEGKRRVDLTICASYDSGIETVKETLREAVASVPQVLKDEDVFARVTGYKDNGIEYAVRAWCFNDDYWDAYFNLLEAMKNTFDAKGVQMSYPNINVHMYQK